MEALHQEVAYIAYHFHWSREEVLEMAHPERGRWVDEIARINRRMSGDED